MVLPCCACAGCLGPWTTLGLWLQAESLWEPDKSEMAGVFETPYWPGSLEAPW
jgi:hypothetical protein